jgi:plastocyanin
MIRTKQIAAAISLTLALAWMPGCDKGKDSADKPAADKPAADEPVADESKTDEHAQHGEPAAAEAEAAEVEAGGRVEVKVDASGYHPATINAPAGAKITLAFTRTTAAGCGQQLVLADLDIDRELPVDETVEIEVEVPASGELGFACGMNMYKGKVVATQATR